MHGSLEPLCALVSTNKGNYYSILCACPDFPLPTSVHIPFSVIGGRLDSGCLLQEGQIVVCACLLKSDSCLCMSLGRRRSDGCGCLLEEEGRIDVFARLLELVKISGGCVRCTCALS